MKNPQNTERNIMTNTYEDEFLDSPDYDDWEDDGAYAEDDC